MMSGKRNVPRSARFKKLRWLAKTAWRRARAWLRRCDSELRELDAFRKCRRLERKLLDYPRAVPLLTELMNAYGETGQEERRLDVMRRLRDIEEPKQTVPELVLYEQPANVWSNIEEAWYGRVERIVKERSLATIHRSHIRNVLHISDNDTAMVCDELERRGVLGPLDPATGRHQVSFNKRRSGGCRE